MLYASDTSVYLPLEHPEEIPYTVELTAGRVYYQCRF